MPSSLFSVRLFTLLLCLSSSFLPAGNAQTTPRPAGPNFNPIYHTEVEKGTRQLSAPFAGGMSAPQFAQADFDRDGLLDLVIYETYSGTLDVRTFLNKGTAGAPKYEYAQRYANYFINVAGAPRYPTTVSDVSNFIRLIDYNCDGIPDLFTGGHPGVHISKGAYNSRNELFFTYTKALYYPSVSGPINVYVSGSDLPGIADVDGDGDIDLITYAAAGSKMEWYRNYRVERRLPCDSFVVELETSCWGRALQGVNRTLFTRMNPICTAQNPPLWDPGAGGGTGPVYLPAGTPTAAKTTAHGSNTICLIDMEGDGDIDVLNSSESFDDLQLQINGRRNGSEVNATDSIVAQDTLWQWGGRVAALHSFPAAFYTDIDADGKRDIIVAPHFSNETSKDQNQVWWYRNTGTAVTPVFAFQKDSLICEDMIDAGSNSHPLFYDFNRDGKPDILVGATVTDINAARRNQLAYYENVTTLAGSPKYRFVTANLANIETLSPEGCVPAVGDLDGDGKDDLLIGLRSGLFAFYKNTAATNALPPVWVLSQTTLASFGGAVVQAEGNYAAPLIRDINGDGRPDILCGSSNGMLSAFINMVAVAGVPNFGSRIDSLGKAVVDSVNGTRISAPYIGPADSTGNTYLVMGSNSGQLSAWKFADSTALTAVYTRANGTLGNVKSPGRSAPAIADMDGDGRLEMLLGGKWGGLNLYWTGPPAADALKVPQVAATPALLFPNPASNQLTIRRQTGADGDFKLALRTILGQLVQSGMLPAGSVQTTFETAHLPAGMYLLSVQSAAGMWTGRVQILR